MIGESRGDIVVMGRLRVAATFIPTKVKLDRRKFVKHIKGLECLK